MWIKINWINQVGWDMFSWCNWVHLVNVNWPVVSLSEVSEVSKKWLELKVTWGIQFKVMEIERTEIFTRPIQSSPKHSLNSVDLNFKPELQIIIIHGYRLSSPSRTKKTPSIATQKVGLRNDYTPHSDLLTITIKSTVWRDTSIFCRLASKPAFAVAENSDRFPIVSKITELWQIIPQVAGEWYSS